MGTCDISTQPRGCDSATTQRSPTVKKLDTGNKKQDFSYSGLLNLLASFRSPGIFDRKDFGLVYSDIQGLLQTQAKPGFHHMIPLLSE